MGLDITAYEKAVLAEPPEDTDEARDAAWDSGMWQVTCIPAFEQSQRGLTDGAWYQTYGVREGFQAGSYSGYNVFRSLLCQAALGVEPDAVWANPDQYRDQPFFELINFSDCEGEIGPDACADLAADFRDNRETVCPKLAEHDGYYIGLYDLWTAAFDLAANTGIVCFH